MPYCNLIEIGDFSVDLSSNRRGKGEFLTPTLGGAIRDLPPSIRLSLLVSAIGAVIGHRKMPSQRPIRRSTRRVKSPQKDDNESRRSIATRLNSPSQDEDPPFATLSNQERRARNVKFEAPVASRPTALALASGSPPKSSSTTETNSPLMAAEVNNRDRPGSELGLRWLFSTSPTPTCGAPVTGALGTGAGVLQLPREEANLSTGDSRWNETSCAMGATAKPITAWTPSNQTTCQVTWGVPTRQKAAQAPVTGTEDRGAPVPVRQTRVTLLPVTGTNSELRDMDEEAQLSGAFTWELPSQLAVKRAELGRRIKRQREEMRLVCDALQRTDMTLLLAQKRLENTQGITEAEIQPKMNLLTQYGDAASRKKDGESMKQAVCRFIDQQQMVTQQLEAQSRESERLIQSYHHTAEHHRSCLDDQLASLDALVLPYEQGARWDDQPPPIRTHWRKEVLRRETPTPSLTECSASTASVVTDGKTTSVAQATEIRCMGNGEPVPRQRMQATSAPVCREQSTTTVPLSAAPTEETRAGVRVITALASERATSFLMKPRCFDEQEPFEHFERLFSDAAAINGWTDFEKARFLPQSLPTRCYAVIQDVPTEAPGAYAAMVAALTRRYGMDATTGAYRSLLSARRQGQGEALIDYAHELKRITLKAYPNMDETQRDALALRVFLTGMRDTELARQVQHLVPSTLDKALAKAITLSTLNADDEIVRETPRGGGLVFRTRVKSRTPVRRPPSQWSPASRLRVTRPLWIAPHPLGTPARSSVLVNNGRGGVSGIYTPLNAVADRRPSDLRPRRRSRDGQPIVVTNTGSGNGFRPGPTSQTLVGSPMVVRRQ